MDYKKIQKRNERSKAKFLKGIDSILRDFDKSIEKINGIKL